VLGGRHRKKSKKSHLSSDIDTIEINDRLDALVSYVLQDGGGQSERENNDIDLGDKSCSRDSGETVISVTYTIDKKEEIEKKIYIISEKDFNLYSNENGVTLTVREVLEKGVVRILWRGLLNKHVEKDIIGNSNGIFDENRNSSIPPIKKLVNHDSFEGSGSLPFITKVTQSLDDAMAENNALRTSNADLRRRLAGWKETAEVLDERWQVEKDKFASRFLVLLNRVKSEYRRQRELWISREESGGGVQAKGIATQSSFMAKDMVNVVEKGNRKKKVEEIQKYYNKFTEDNERIDSRRLDLVDSEVGHDVATFDLEEVERLATGQPINPPPLGCLISGDDLRIEKGATNKYYPCEDRCKHNHDRDNIIDNNYSTEAGHDLELKQTENYCGSDNKIISQLPSTRSTSNHVRKNPHTGALEMWDAGSIFSQEQKRQQNNHDCHYRNQYVRKESFSLTRCKQQIPIATATITSTSNEEGLAAFTNDTYQHEEEKINILDYRNTKENNNNSDVSNMSGEFSKRVRGTGVSSNVDDTFTEGGIDEDIKDDDETSECSSEVLF